MRPIFRHVARAIIIKDGKVLTARLIGRHAFFPGGGVEVGERAEDALLRELQEELGVEGRVLGFLGCIEQLLSEKSGQLHHTIAHFFEVEVPGLSPDIAPASRESHLLFQWADLEELRTWRVYPESTHGLIRALMQGDRSAWWASEA